MNNSREGADGGIAAKHVGAALVAALRRATALTQTYAEMFWRAESGFAVRRQASAIESDGKLSHSKKTEKDTLRSRLPSHKGRPSFVVAHHPGGRMPRLAGFGD